MPAHPELVAILRQHIADFGTDAEGRLFRGEQGDQSATATHTRLWGRASKTAFGEDLAAASLLARRPYDLRHAAVSVWLNGGLAGSADEPIAGLRHEAVSMWLNGGVGPARVAQWAGHSVDVLLRIYAKCIDGQEATDLCPYAASRTRWARPPDLAQGRPLRMRRVDVIIRRARKPRNQGANRGWVPVVSR